MAKDQINVPGITFNEDGELYNDDAGRAGRPNFLRRTYPPGYFDTPLVSNSPVPNSGRRVVQKVATPRDLPAGRITHATSVPRHVSFRGSFSAVRAMRIAHQYRVNFWEESGVVGVFGANNGSDPSEAEVDTLYADLLLHNYMPSSMVVSRDEFADMVKPQRRTELLLGAVAKMGIQSQQEDVLLNVGAADDQGAVDLDDLVPLISPPPFAESLQTACPGDDYFRRTGPLALLAEQTNVV